jgi:hypothetical protein
MRLPSLELRLGALLLVHLPGLALYLLMNTISHRCLLSCSNLRDVAKAHGVSPFFSNNSVLAVAISAGGVSNIIYCVYLLAKVKNRHARWAHAQRDMMMNLLLFTFRHDMFAEQLMGPVLFVWDIDSGGEHNTERLHGGSSRAALFI